MNHFPFSYSKTIVLRYYLFAGLCVKFYIFFRYELNVVFSYALYS